MKHIILSYKPFTVEFISETGDITLKYYNSVLTEEEILLQYKYVKF